VKAEAELQNQIRILLDAELNRRLAESQSRLPTSCTHNHRQPLDERKLVDGHPNENYNRISLPVVQTIGLCMLGAEDPETWNGTICEDPIDAQRCPVFDPKRPVQAVRDEFHEQIRDLDWVRSNLPEIYGLLWVLGTEKPAPVELEPAEPESESLPLPVTVDSIPVMVPELSWWKRFICRLLKIEVVPLGPKMLPPGP
jgi:hypothetical protein